ncbi:ArsR/SmtB family transcription factor [Rhizosphaericola mali]|jgi:ArsR family transcriptional regulator, virulence genes transcriptional regulator|uniref:Helix-turn-helix transcriptional regulator n=1 Tax=Rhizosphaericola mali TaxID=2545455 RepID=A0A5P2G414_9BACT|nr:metalloregulator ArsR/SmtB family transcription factor [Rhizosphaericola mali]QES89957.1 helix-turn-helix transcriptional regulator [Rhizosphaericola mali]
MSQQQILLKNPESKSETSIDFIQLKKAALTLRALNHKLRLQIIKLIDEKQKLTVTEIYIKLRIEQSVASQHLAILRRANIVDTQREGKFIYYTLNYARIDEINGFVGDLLK